MTTDTVVIKLSANRVGKLRKEHPEGDTRVIEEWLRVDERVTYARVTGDPARLDGVPDLVEEIGQIKDEDVRWAFELDVANDQILWQRFRHLKLDL